MSKSFPHVRTALAVLLLSTTAAQAQLVADDVRANWIALLSAGDGTVSIGSETRSGGTLALEGVTVATPVEEGALSMDLGRIAFVEQGDGSVRIEMGPSYTLTIAQAPQFGTPMEMTLTFSQPGMSLLARGTPEDMVHDFTAKSVGIELSRLVVDGETIPAQARLSIADPKGTYGVATQGTLRRIDTEFTGSALFGDVSVEEPGGPGVFSLVLETADVTLGSELSVPQGGSFVDMPAMLSQGFASASRFAYGAASFDFNFIDGQEQLRGSGTIGSGRLENTLDARSLSYDTATSGLGITLEGTAIPLPQISFGMAEGGFGLKLPLAPSTTPADFALKLGYRGIEVGEEVWGLFDPAQAIPRTPANLVADITGTATVKADLMNPEVMAGMAGPPGELNTVTLNELDLAAGGARLTGAGAFTFDNSDLSTFDGMPAPEGAVDLMLTGGNALLDTLVDMGFVSADEAMGARMMLGLFARPGDGPDSLVSRIEVTADGQVLANGQRIR